MSQFEKSLSMLDQLIAKLERNVSLAQKESQKTPKKLMANKQNNTETTQQQEIQKTEQQNQQIKEKKPKQKKEQKQPTKGKNAPKTSLDIFQEADLRVGEIIDAQKVDGNDKLYIEKIKFSDTETRTILSGLQQHVQIENMKGKCIVFYNLQPRPIAKIPSEGMVMCVSNSDKSKIDLLRPDPDTPLNTRVNLLGKNLELNDVGFINQKNTKKFLELLTTDEEGLPCYDKIKMGCCDKDMVKNMPNGTIS